MFVLLAACVCILALDVDPVDVPSSPVDAESVATQLKAPQASAGAATATEALRGAPGVMVRSFGGPFDFATLSIRGSSSTQVGLYLDGVSLTTASVGSVDLSTLVLLDAEELTIYRGLAPAFLGPEAFMGGIHIKRRKKRFFGGQTSVSVGSFAARQFALVLAAPALGWSWQVSALYSGKQGDFTFFSDGGTPLQTRDDRYVQRTNNDLNALDARVETQRNNVRIAASVFAKEQGAPAPSDDPQANARYAMMRPVLQLSVNEWRPNDWLTLNTSMSGIAQLGRFTSVRRSLYATATEQSTTETEARGQLVATVAAAAWLTLTFSGNASHARFDATAPSLPTQRRERTLIGTSASATASVFGLEIQAQSRFDGVLDRGEVAPSLYQPERLDTVSNNRVWAQPTLGIKGEPTAGLSLFAHVGARARPPSFYELFGSNGQVRGNPQLKAERQWTWDAGVGFHRRWLNAEALFSEARLNDVITFVQQGSDLPVGQNVASATVRSLELSARSTPLSWLSVGAFYTLQLSRSGDGFPLPGRPAHVLRANVSVFAPQPVKLRATYEIYYIDQMYLDTAGTRTAPARYPSSVSVTWQPFSLPFFVAVEMQNIFDQTTAVRDARLGSVRVQTVDVLGYPLPGRSVFFTLTHAFGDRAQALGDALCAIRC